VVPSPGLISAGPRCLRKGGHIAPAAPFILIAAGHWESPMVRRNASPTVPIRRRARRWPIAIRIFAVLLVLGASPGWGFAGLAAAPTAPQSTRTARNDIPGWMSAETAASLDLGFDVLVPPEVPSPFDGEPAVEVSDGYYQLYWLIPGAPPTYLLITGEVGGSIPDFSYYDRNVQLEINADVQGTPAYHDLTPIYDRVYWQVDNVVYTVDSHNLDATDSLTLANSLFPLGGAPPADTGDNAQTDNGTGGNASGEQGGNETGGQGGNETQSTAATLEVPDTIDSGDVASVTVGGVSNATLSADGGTFAASGEATVSGAGTGSYDWTAPDTETDLTVSFTLADGDSGETLATAQTVVQAAPSPASVGASLRCPAVAAAGQEARISLAGQGTLTVDASDGTFPAKSPNTKYAPDADGSDVLRVTLGERNTISLVWLAPDAEMTAYIFVYDADGNTIAECGTELTYDEIATTTATPTPKKSGPAGDGTDLGDRYDALVATVLAHRSSPVGDATGAPKAAAVTPIATADAVDTAIPTPSPATTPKPTMTPKPTATPTATLAPVSLSAGGVAQTIGPEGGELRCPSGSGATLSVPAGSLKEPSWITIRPMDERDLPTPPSIKLLAGTAFDVTVALANGESVEKLGVPATLTITLPKDAAKANLMLYRVAGTRLEPLSNVKVEGNTISAPLTKVAKIVAGVPTPAAAASTGRDSMPFILVALGIIVALMALFAAGSVLLRRRPRTVTPRRGFPTRARVR
jgi:hypothetical protein